MIFLVSRDRGSLSSFSRCGRSRQTLNQPPAGGTRRRVDLVHHLQRVLSAAPITKIQLHEPSGFNIGTNHRFGHSAPSDAPEKKLLLRCQIADPPGRETDNTEVSVFGCRFLRQNNLDVILSVRGRSALCRCKRMVGGGNGNEPHAADLNSPQTSAVHVQYAPDADAGAAVGMTRSTPPSVSIKSLTGTVWNSA